MKTHTTSILANRLHRGASLIELIIVLFIISILVSLLFPAIQRSREQARIVSCQNNLRNLGLALITYCDSHKRLPGQAPPNRVGGWSIEIMPYMEESARWQEFRENPPVDVAARSLLALDRPAVLTCPNGNLSDSDTPPIPVANYYCQLPPMNRNKYTQTLWQLYDLPEDTAPWVTSPEAQSNPAAPGPHLGGFNVYYGNGIQHGRVEFVPAR